MSSSSKREVGSARPSSATNKGAASGSLSARSAHPSESNTRPVSATSTTRGSHSGSLSARSAPSSTAAKQRLAQPASARGSRPTTAFGGLDDDAPKEVPAKILDQAKLSGQLNLANRNLTSLPDRVWALDDEPMVLDQPSQGLSTDTVPDFNAQRNSDDERNSWWNRTLMQKLLLANNQLTSLDEGLGRLRMLTTLDISHNQLQTLPEAIGECTKLQRMLLSHNQLGQLPASIGKLDDLRLLKIDNNQLSDLPESLNNCAFLEELDASQNRLECLPKNLFDGCRRIRSLKLNCNKLTGLAPDIGWLQSLQNLTSLDVSDNQLGPSLAKEIGELTRLEQLYAGSNRIAVIQGLERCSELKELNLACNLIEELDDDFFRNMTQLMAIDLRENKLKAIPQSVLKLNALERLNLERNDISNVPPTLSLLPHLKTLIMSNNPIKTIRRDILQRGSSELLKYLKTRIAPEDETEQKKSEDNLFDGINARISDGIRTKRLDLSCRALTDLSTDIVEKLKGKEIHLIDLSQNQFSAFPSSVTAMSDSLRDLSLNKNQLTALSDDVSRLRCLTTLKLSANRLGTLPDSLAECANLFELDISNNCFTSIPDVVYKLVKLESLFASDNKIALIDVDRLLPMVQLANLGLANNEITQVPPQLGLMKLKSLQLEGNGFKVPRAQTLAKGTAEVLLYLRGRIPGYVEE